MSKEELEELVFSNFTYLKDIIDEKVSANFCTKIGLLNVSNDCTILIYSSTYIYHVHDTLE